MYFNILKKDLKRKKTMNIILFLFIILASMFVSSSVNNLLSILTATDDYVEKAELADYNICIVDTSENTKKMDGFVKTNKYVQSYNVYQMPAVTKKNITLGNGKEFGYQNQVLFCSTKSASIKLFDSENHEITEVNEDEIYMTPLLMKRCGIEKGDKIHIKNEEYSKDFIVAGEYKNLIFGSEMVGMAECLINNKELEEICSKSQFCAYKGYSIFVDNPDEFIIDFNNSDISIIISMDPSLVKMMYIMDMITAGVVLIVSICLIIIAIVILCFTINFTLNEEFREIGVMKAIGIKNAKIRWLYCFKYFVISVVGSAVGLALGIPFGKMLIAEVSENIIIDSDINYSLNILCAVAVVAVIMCFCFGATRKIKKFTPIDAIRSGSNGERYKGKGILRLSHSKVSVISFLAFNDIFSAIRKFGVLILTFTIGIILIIIPVNTTNTLKSDKLVRWFSMDESDVYITNEALFKEKNKSRKMIEDNLHEMELLLSKEGIEAKLHQEIVFKFRISYDEKSYNSMAFQGVNITCDKYAYTSGTAPQNENEVAITHIIAEKVGANIGDKVKITLGNEEKEFIVTAVFQTMTNMGEGIRFYETLPIDYQMTFGEFAMQINYTDSPSATEKKERLQKIKTIFPDYKVYTGGQYINEMIGNLEFDDMIHMIVIVVLCINALVAILIIRSFIAKETGEIGMLKAIGFRNSAIISWQTMRIGIVLVLSMIFGAFISNLIAQPSVGVLFKMMGASSIEFEVKPLEVYLLYPLVVFVVTMIASFLTAQQVRTISASETSNIE